MSSPSKVVCSKKIFLWSYVFSCGLFTYIRCVYTIMVWLQICSIFCCFVPCIFNKVFAEPVFIKFILGHLLGYAILSLKIAAEESYVLRILSKQAQVSNSKTYSRTVNLENYKYAELVCTHVSCSLLFLGLSWKHHRSVAWYTRTGLQFQGGFVRIR